MKATRLLITLLALLLALPVGAGAMETIPPGMDIRITYEDPTLGADPVDAVYPDDYLWGFSGLDPNRIWIQVLTDRIPMDRVSITLILTDNGEVTEYTFVDAFGSVWLNLVASEASELTYQAMLGDQYFMTDYKLTMSMQEIPQYTEGGGMITDPNYVGEGDTITDPNYVGEGDTITDPNYVGEGDTITDPNYVGEGDTITDPNYVGEGDTITGPNYVGEGDTIIDPNYVGEGDTITDPNYTGEGVVASTLNQMTVASTPPPDRPSNYAVVGQDGGYFYPVGGSDANMVWMEHGVLLEYLGNEPDAWTQYQDGSMMALVQLVDGQRGRVNTEAFTFISQQDYELTIAFQKAQQAYLNRETDYATVTIGTTLVNRNAEPVRTIEAGKTLIYKTDWETFVYSNMLYIPVVLEEESGQSPNYARMDQIRFLTTAELNSYRAGEPQTIQAPAVENPVSAVSAITPDPPVIAEGEGRHAYVLMPRIVVREVPNGSQVGEVNVDDIVYVHSTRLDKNGDTWYEITIIKAKESKFNNVHGYILYSYPEEKLRLMTDEEESLQSHYESVVATPTVTPVLKTPSPAPTDPPTNPPTDQPTSAPTDVPTEAPTPPPTPTQEIVTPSPLPALTQYSGYMRVVAVQYTVLNAFPAYGAATIGILNRGDVVYVQGQQYDASGNVWHETLPLYSGASLGYTPDVDLVRMTAQEVTQYFGTQAPTQTPVPTYSPNTQSGYGLVTNNSVNFRSTPSLSTYDNVIARLQQYTIVRVLSEKTSEGATWYEAESMGKTGYIHSDYLAPLTIAEYQALMSSPSYNQNGNIVTPTSTANVSGGYVPTWSTPNANAGTTASSTSSFVTIAPLLTPDPNATATVDPSASPTADPSASPEASDDLLAGSVTPTPDVDATLPPPADPSVEPEETSGGFSPPGLLLALVVLLVLAAGGFYGYSVYNKTRRVQSEERAEQLAKEAGAQGDGTERPAVRRPVPPTGTETKSASGSAYARPDGQNSTTATGRTVAPQKPNGTTPPSGSSGQVNPYARPTTQAGTSATTPAAKEQEVSSTVPRAHVDGKPVSASPNTTPASPYARSQTPPTSEGAQPARPQQPNAPANAQQGAAKTASSRPAMPIAPSAVEPDDLAKSGEPQAPRRRRRPSADETPDDSK